ncbi:hypothetical protein PIIN_02808 [Serendipita indica DSM 11827]|uniref:Uncharacterized protein n=1 Tax=Serendipita indica (strain DSM 11827) TaxID=1109443 RepID=G4TC91_SERID|nr:hypothetical protein PIIN_02808 [Serendipita indica DSM 11827]
MVTLPLSRRSIDPLLSHNNRVANTEPKQPDMAHDPRSLNSSKGRHKARSITIQRSSSYRVRTSTGG